MSLRSVSLLLLSGVAAAASAAPYTFITWDTATATSTFAHGTIGSVGVDFSGPFAGVMNNYNPFGVDPSNYIGGQVGNAPDTNAFAKINVAGTFTLTFSQAVSGLAFDLWSVGAPNSVVSYSFDQNLSIVAGGPNTQYGGSILTNVGNVVYGQEGNGTVFFAGPITSLTFVVTPAEDYHGFTLGLSSVPGPAPLMAYAAGGLAPFLRRRKRA